MLKKLKKVRLPKFKFKKKTTVEQPKIKPKLKGRDIFKKINVQRLVLGSAGFILALGVYGSISSFFTQSKIRSMKNEIATFKKDVQQDKQQNYFDTYSGKQFIDKFLPKFINVGETIDERNEQAKELANFFPKDFKLPSDTNVGSRKLKDYTIKRITPKQSDMEFELDVTFETVVKAEKERTVKDKDKKDVVEKYTDEKTTESTKTMNILVSSDNNKFLVATLPYFSTETDVLGSQKDVDNPLLQMEKVNSVDEQNAIEEFTKDFFEKYASSASKDMGYMMDKPSSLDGKFKYVQTVSEDYYVLDGGFNLVSAEVEFEDVETGFKHVEMIYLKISKNEKKYMVNIMDHNLKGVL